MSEVEVPANCRFCGYLCGLSATVDDGRVVSVRPDPTRFPYDESVQNGCHRWRATVEIMDHPDRVNYPIKRAGGRGEGKWRRITWDEALDDIASRLTQLAQEFGPETLASSIAGPHSVFWPLHRFMNLFGSPNNVGIGQICWNPGIWLNTVTFGWPLEPDFDVAVTGALMLWATNPAQSDNSLFWRSVREFSSSARPLIVVDPRRTRTAARADVWLPARAGTDAWLALGLINVIIDEGLYDHEFVDRWCLGFDDLGRHVSRYTPDTVAEVTGVPAADVIAAARLYSTNGPACLVTGRGIDQLGPNTPPTHRALAILRAITGGVDRAGSATIPERPDFIPEVDLEGSDLLSASQRAKHLNRGHLTLQTPEGYERVRKLTERAGRRLPMRYLTSVHPDLVWTAMIKGEPYPIRAMVVVGSDPIMTQADSGRVHDALASLDLLVALELFKTPTAALADYILPVAGGLERPLFQTSAGISNLAYGGDAAVEPYYERRPDYFFFRELGLRLGQGEHWPAESLTDEFAALLAPAGVTWETFRQAGLYYAPAAYGKYAQADPVSGLVHGFATESGKVELRSDLLAELGSEALPVPKPVPKLTDAFPMTLLTGARKQPYYASSYHQVASLARLYKRPQAEMSVRTAEGLGLREGDQVRVETERGEATFTLRTDEMVDDTISVDYGWWEPDGEPTEPELCGAWKSNANVLTNCDISASDLLIGTWTYNGLPCRVSRGDRSTADEVGS